MLYWVKYRLWELGQLQRNVPGYNLRRSTSKSEVANKILTGSKVLWSWCGKQSEVWVGPLENVGARGNLNQIFQSSRWLVCEIRCNLAPWEPALGPTWQRRQCGKQWWERVDGMVRKLLVQIVTVPIPQSPPKPSPSVDNAPKPHVDSFSDSDSSDAPSIHTPARTYNWHAWQISRTRASKKRRRKMRKTSPSPTPTRRRQKDTQAPVHHPSSTLPSKPSPPIPPIPVQSQPSDETLLDSLQWFTSNKDWTIQAGRLGLKIRDQDTEGPEFVKHCKALLEDTIGRWNPPVPSSSLMKQAWQVLLLKDRAMLGALISLMKIYKVGRTYAYGLTVQ
ncbi:hypothetical protein F5890DRAFT_1479173 [Lentinula detonsa]|uniref:Uncharacterized protein n=1 Tax=Lentinula detonsa TaxID=2804962 RepID=A0AA38PND2_9AGAR|nr:hypothetical protein F5890DRAFT_1479173 [Lentinula detonsa]